MSHLKSVHRPENDISCSTGNEKCVDLSETADTPPCMRIISGFCTSRFSACRFVVSHEHQKTGGMSHTVM